MSTVPFPLKRKAGDIARYYLYDNNPTEHVKNEFDNAIAWLRSVAAGKVSLGPNEAGKPTPSNNGAEMVTSGHVFGRSDTGFI
ncbi:hypothetical protein SPV1_02772 [Mariprofundus ferrooxydans PV-1]|uniref:Uncharacterized protein n=1 Tax=Mariprofundus ferrooxydans PV-1 TaxID=314345 RepID=Q0F1R4_9PROT|nr:hypothetical protein SPV1_02772 [Mariprofundus ferrooxydans PV-1]